MGGSFPTVRAGGRCGRSTAIPCSARSVSWRHDGFVTTNRTAGRTVTTDEGLVTRMKESIAKKSIEKFIKEMAAIGYSADDVVKMIKERGEEDK